MEEIELNDNSEQSWQAEAEVGDSTMKKEIADNTAKQQRGRPFRRGESGNPFGRPKGSLNKATRLAQALIDDNAEELTQSYLTEASKGDAKAIRWMLDRVIPPKREERMCVELPKLEAAGDLPGFMTALVMAMRNGEITSSQLETALKLVAIAERVFRQGDVERRVVELERRVADLPMTFDPMQM